jgi:tyrosine-protein kinase Etk/Wzc
MSAIPIERRAANRVPPAPATGDAFGLRSAIDAVLQHGRLATGVFALVLALATLYQWLAAPVYRADTVIEIDGRSRQSLLPNFSGTDRSAAAENDRVIASGEIEVMRSRELVIPAILASGADIELSGARRYGFLPVGSRHGVDVPWFQVPEAWRDRAFRLEVEHGRWTLFDDKGSSLASGLAGQAASITLSGEQGWLVVNAPRDLASTTLTLRARSFMRAYEDVIERMRMFEPARDSSVLRVSFEDTKPARAAALLNFLAINYVRHFEARRTGDSRRALSYLEQQLPQLQARMAEAEDALRAYQGRTTAAPLASEVDSIFKRRADLERQQIELRIKRDHLAQIYTSDHPELASVIAQLRTVEHALGRLEGSAEQLPSQQRDIVRLQREVQVSTQLYTAMAAQVQQLRISNAGLISAARQIDPAVEPAGPVRPKAVATLSIGAGIGLLLALGTVLLRRALQPTVKDVHELHSVVASQPTVAIIPQSDAQVRLMENGLRDGAAVEDLGLHRVLARAAPADPAVESLRSVHLSLMLRSRSAAGKVVLVTAPTTGTGKSFVAANLAAVMAEAGKNVLLIDADLRRPGLHRLVGLDEHAPGLSDVLAEQRTLDDVIRTPAALDVDVILHGTVTSNPGATLLAPNLETIFDELRSRYDQIVVNAAAMLASGDAVAVGRVADYALLVVRAEQSLVRETQVAQRRLEEAGIRLEGILVNGAKRNRLNAPRLK